MFDSPRFKTNLALLERFPNALIAIFRDRDGDVQTALMDVEEDHYDMLECGHLYRSDGEVWAGVWLEEKQAWVDWDDSSLLRSHGVAR